MTGVVADRRPRPVQVAGFVVLLLAVSWGLATFSAWSWTATPPGSARLRVSFKHVTGFSGPVVRQRDVEGLPAHMRPLDGSRPTTGRRAGATLTIEVDGARVLARAYRPTGLRRDGPVYGYEEIAITPGVHVVRATLAEDAGASREWSTTATVAFAAGRAPLLEFRPGEGWRQQ